MSIFDKKRCSPELKQVSDFTTLPVHVDRLTATFPCHQGSTVYKIVLLLVCSELALETRP